MPRAFSVDHVQLAMPRGEEQSARDFYAGLLGLVEIPKPADLVARGGVWFRCGELQVHLGVEDPFRPAKKAHPAFVVDDLAAFVNLLRRRRLPAPTPVEKIAGGARIFTEDPFGNRIELIQTGDAKAKKSDMTAGAKIKVVDIDGDGVLGRGACGGSRAMFEKMDTNKDGLLSKDELAAGHARMMKKSP